MALVLTEEQSMLRDSARGLISDKAPVSHLRQLRDAKDATGFSRDLWKTFAEMGFSGLLVPEDFGGSGLGCVEAGVVMEEIGRTLMPSPFLATAVLAASALSRGGSAAQKSEHLPKISRWLAAGRACHRRGRQTSAAADQHAGGAFRQWFQAPRRQGLRGRRPHRRSFDRRGAHRGRGRRARRADAVPGRSQSQGHRDRAHRDGRFAQRRAASASTMSRSMPTACSARSIRAAPAGRRAQYRPRRGRLRNGRAQRGGVRPHRRLSEGAQAVRQAIGEFQALQHRAAQLYIEIEITRAAVLKALQTLDANFDKAGAAVAVAKARAGSTATLAVQEGVQMHGGMGMTDQFDIGFFMKRARVCQELFGDSQFPCGSAGADEEVLRDSNMSFRDGRRTRPAVSEVPGSRLRAPRNDGLTAVT